MVLHTAKEILASLGHASGDTVSGSPGTVWAAAVVGPYGNTITLAEGLTGGRMGR
jgi:hypothetical protein